MYITISSVSFGTKATRPNIKSSTIKEIEAKIQGQQPPRTELVKPSSVWDQIQKLGNTITAQTEEMWKSAESRILN